MLQLKHSILIGVCSLGFLAVVSGCWETQDHGITQPEIPHYRLTGNVVTMIDTSIAVPEGRVEIVSGNSSYDVEFTPQSRTLDSNGFFQFDTIYPGAYVFEIYRGDHLVAEEMVNMAHEDRRLQFDVPKPLKTKTAVELEFPGPKLGKPLLITWLGQKAWTTGSYNDQGDMISALYQCEVVQEGGKVILRPLKYYDNPLPGSITLSTADDLLYLALGAQATILDPRSGQIIDDMMLDNQKKFYGLTQNSTGIWTTFGRLLQFRDENVRTVDATYITEGNNMKPITTVGNTFYTFDAGGGLFLRLRQDGTITEIYRLLKPRNQSWINAHDVEFSKRDSLFWITAGSSQIFTAEVP